MNYTADAALISSTPQADSQGGGTLFWNVSIPAHSSVDLKVILRPSSDINAHARFHPQGSGYVRSTFPSTGSGIPRPATVPQTTDPASSVPSVPSAPLPSGTPPSGTGAITYTPPASSGAATFTGSQLKATIKEATGSLPNDDGTTTMIMFQSGNPFCAVFTVQNTGTTAVNNVMLQLSIPPEYENRVSSVRSNGKYNRQNKTIELTAGTIPSGGKAEIQILLPTITLQGYQFTGRVLVNGTEVEKQTQRIVPLR
jgi:hypothetical protein